MKLLSKRKFWPKLCPNLDLLWPKILSKITKCEWISEFSNLYHGNAHTDLVSSQYDNDWSWYWQKDNFAQNFTHIWTFLGQNFVKNLKECTIFLCIPYKYKDWRSSNLKQQIMDIKLIFYYFLIISYKFGAYIKRLSAISRHDRLTCDKVSTILTKTFQINWPKTAKYCFL